MSAAGHVTALRGTAPALRRAEPDAGSGTPHVLRPSGPLLPLVFARGGAFFCLATFGALHWMAMLEPDRDRAGVVRRRVGAARAARACWPPPGCAACSGGWRSPAPCSSRSPSRSWPPACPPSCCGPATGTRWPPASSAASARCPERACPTAGSTTGRGSSSRSAARCSPCSRRLTAFWPRRATTGFPFAALVLLVTLYAVPAVALDFDGEFLRGALLAVLVLAFLRLERLRADRGGGRRHARGRHGDRGADRRARARRRHAVVGLRDVGAVDGRVEVDDVLVGSRLRPARLAPRRPRDAAREGQAGRVLEGGEPRHLRRQALGPGRVRLARGGRQRAARRADRRSSASRSGSRCRCATCARARSSPPAIPSCRRRCRTARRSPPARPASGRRAARCRGATATASTSTRRSRPSARSARRGASTTARSTSTARSRSSTSRARTPARHQHPAALVIFPEWDLRNTAPTAIRPSFGTVEPRRRDPERVLARSGMERTWALAQRLRARRRHPAGLRQVGRGLPRARLHLHRGAAAEGADDRGLPVRREVGLLPAVLGRDGAAAAHGRHPRAGVHRLHRRLLRPQGQGVRRARPRRPLVGRGVGPRVRLGHL